MQSGAKYHDLSAHHAVPSPFPSSNKLIQKKVQKQRQQIHNRQIRAVKAVIDTSPPASFYSQHVNAKKIKMQEDRLEQIEKANNHLVDRMVEIAESSGTIDTHLSVDPTLYVPVSLNMRKRIEEIEKIERENVVIMKRIAAAKGNYSREFPEASTPGRNASKSRQPAPPASKTPRSPHGGNKMRRSGNNFIPLFTIGTKLGALHVKMNIYDKRDGKVRINIYEPLSSRQYPLDLSKDTMEKIVGFEGAELMTSKEVEAKTMWKYFASKLHLVPTSEDSSVYKLVVDKEEDQNPFEIVQTSFEFADPAKIDDPAKYDAALKIQSRFRGGSGRRLVNELNEKKKKALKKGSVKKSSKKSPERKAAEKAEITMIETYEAQAVIAKHFKGHQARKQVAALKESKGRERTLSDHGAVKIQSAFRGKKAKEVVMEKKKQKEGAIAIQNKIRQAKAKKVLAEKKQVNEGAVKIQGLMRVKKAKAEVEEKKQMKVGATKIQGVFRGKKAKEEVAEKKQMKAGATKIQGKFRQKKAKDEVQRRRAESLESERLKKQQEEESAAAAKAEAKKKADEEAAAAAEAEAKKKAEEEAAAAAETEAKKKAEEEAAAAAETGAKRKSDEVAAAAAEAEAKKKAEEEAAAAAETEAKRKSDEVAAAAVEAEAKKKAEEEAAAAAEEKKGTPPPSPSTHMTEGVRETPKLISKVAESSVEEIIRAATPVRRVAEGVVREVIEAATPERQAR